MSIYPKAKVRLLPESEYQAKIIPDQFIFHTAVDGRGPSDLRNFFEQSGLESHFWIPWSGEVHQFIDTEVRADANYKANRRPNGHGAISVETEDDGNPEANPWNQKQIDALIDLGRWVVDEHNIPTVYCPTWDSPGFGWHAMWSFDDPIKQVGTKKSLWTPSFGKTCPGKTRIYQIRTIIFPAIASIITPTDEELYIKRIQEACNRAGANISVDGIIGPNTTVAVENMSTNLIGCIKNNQDKTFALNEINRILGELDG